MGVGGGGASPTIGSLFISQPETLAIDTLPVRGSIAKVVRRLSESNVVELRCRIYDINICHGTI